MRNILLSFILFFSSISYSQNNWFWQNPSPTGSHILDSYFIDNNIGYAVGVNGTILKTTNGGSNWFQQISGNNKFLTSVFFLNRDTGFVTTGDESFPVTGSILKTTNGGNNWEILSSFGNTHLSSIVFINNETGYAVGGKYFWGSSLYKTSNGGISWNEYPSLQTNFMFSVEFVNENTGFIAGDDGKIFRTTNGGLNWDTMNTGLNNYTLYRSIKFVNQDTGFAVGNGGRIYKTIDQGANWYQQNDVTSQNLWDVQFINNNTGYIAAGGSWFQVSGKLLKTIDGGITWDSLNIPNYNNFRSISILDSSNLLAFGFWGTILKTTTEGIAWSNISNSFVNPTNDFKKIKFKNENTGYIISEYGYLYKTTSSGSNWFVMNPSANIELNDISIQNQNVICVGDSGIVVTSTNSGLNWNQQYLNLNFPYSTLNSVGFINDTTGFVGGSINGGKILKTTNFGQSWNTSFSTQNSILSIFVLDSQHIFASGGSYSNISKFYRSSNGGNSWQTINLPVACSIYDIFFLNDSVGFIGGRQDGFQGSYVLLKTTDFGNTWESINLNIPYELYIKDICFINSDYGYLTSLSFPDYGRAGDLFRTTNGGNNWFKFSSFSTYPTLQYRPLNTIFFLDDNTGYIAGELGTLLKTTNGGNTVGILNSNSQIPGKFALYQNYPNPFNPITKIRFELPTNGFVRLTIYNSLGQKISQLVNEKLDIGSYEYEFQSNGFPSGIYYYKLETDSFSETKKMVLIK